MLKVCEPSKECLDVLKESIVNVFPTEVFELKDKKLQITLPHRIYFGGFDPCDPFDVSNLSSDVVRYLLLDEDDKAVAAAEVRETPNLAFRSFNQGVFVEGTVRAIELFENSDHINEDDFEIRFLHMPYAHICALWLKGSNKDYFIPIETFPENLDNYRIYNLEDFKTDFSKISKRLIKCAIY